MGEITQPIHGIAARKKILKGVNAVYDVVKLTLGPEGRNAILPRTFNRGPRHTNDGVTISENIQLSDEHERLAADAFKEGSKKTNEAAGDGTTSTAVVAGHIINKVLLERLDSDVPSASLVGEKAPIKPKMKGLRALRQEMKEAKDLVIAEVKKRAKPIKTLADLEKIALVSIGKEDEEVAKTVAKMVFEIGRDGAGNFIDNHIDVVEGYKKEIETEVIRGNRFPAKAIRNFVNNPDRFEMVAEDVPVFITNYKLDNQFQLIDMLNRLALPKVALLAPDFSPGVIKSLIATTKNGMFCYPVKCPALRTEVLEDIAVYTGATVVDKDTGRKLENVTSADLGFASKIIVKDTENREDAVLLGGRGEKVKRGAGNLVTERCEVLKKQIKESRNEVTTITLQKRIANLSSAIGVIKVGSTTSAEGLYLKLKIEDAVYSCKAALEEGYVEGGGICLKEISELLPENILTESLKAPYNQIQKNAGGNLKIGKEIIDSAKVVRLVVEHGVSVASMMITTEILIPEMREKSPAEGYESIAGAIRQYAKFWAMREGLIKDSEDEAEKDRNEEFDKVILADKG
jgi:chaperonin GroEL